MSKAALRIRLMTLRKNMSADDVAKKSKKIAQRVLALPQVKAAKAVLMYADYANEVQTAKMIETLKIRGVDIYLPVIVDKHTFIACKHTDDMQKNRYGIDEPIPIETAPKGSGKLDVAICPGVGFDAKCNRIGHGNGYYDNYLKGENIFKIGLAYDAQVMDDVFATMDDVKMNIIVTERKTYESD